MREIIVSLLTILALTNGKPLAEFANGNNLFAAAVYKEQIKAGGDNFLVCPLSAEIVLALTQSGAKDETAEEIRTSLHLPNSDEKTKTAIKTYLTSIKPVHDDEFYSIHTANKVYVKKHLSLKDEFKQVATDVYQAEVEKIDFAQNTQAARTINNWVEQQTHNKIRNLIEPKDLDESTAAVLINALYFKGRWVDTFKNASTKKADFYKTANDVVKVDTMYQKKKIHFYFESPELKAKFLELPFRGGEASLVIALPDQKDGLKSLEERAPEVFSKHRFILFPVNVALPKFKIENKVDFKEILKKLGVSKVFSREADLSGIAGKKGEMSVAKVVQKAFIDVNEEGVEAAAATAVLPVLGSAFIRDRPKEFVVDHPFIFYIKIKNVVVFAGRVLDPSK